MFGGFFFDHKVSNRLFRMGWKPQDLPPPQLFSAMCKALQANGYDVERAATLWHGAINCDREALLEMRRNTGVYGITAIDENGLWLV